MTCKEKFIKDHPDYSEKQLNSIFDNDCPNDYCIADDPRDAYCRDCWDREIPETEPSESSKETNDELIKRIAELEQKVAELDKKLTEHAEKKIAEAFRSTDISCAQSPVDICHAIALSMFNKYRALLDVGFSRDEALKLTVMWKD